MLLTRVVSSARSFRFGAVVLTAACLLAFPAPNWAQAARSRPPVAELPIASVTKEYLVKVWESDRADLPHYCFTAIAQTPDGYLWLGSFANVSRFDGGRFAVFDHSETRDLPGDMVRRLFVDHQGALWVGTDRGIARWSDGHWQTFTAAQGWPGGMVNSFAEDAHGNLWACADGRMIKLQGDHFVPFPAPDRAEDKSSLYCCVDAEGHLWASSQKYFGHWEAGIWVAVPLAANEVVAGVTPGREGGLWVATGNDLRRFQDGQWTIALERPERFRESAVTLLEDSRGNLWMGGYTKGVLVLMRDGTLLRCTTAEGLGNDATLSLFEDRESHIWIGSNGGGLARLRPRSVVTYDESAGLSQAVVNSITEDSPGHLLVGTHGGGLMRFGPDRFGGVMAVPNPPSGVENGMLHVNSWVHSVVRDSAGVIWAGTFGQGLFRLQGANMERVAAPELRSDTVYSLFHDSKQRLWIGTDSALVCQEKGKYTSYGVKEGVPPMNVRMIAEDPEGNICVGNDDGTALQQQGGRFLPFRAAKDNRLAPSALLTGRDGSLWIGTRSQRLGRLQKNGKLFVYSEKESLPDVGIASMLEDDAGDLWLATSEGIVRITRASLDGVMAGTAARLDCLLLDKSDGLRSLLCRDGFQPASFKSSDGRLWFATVRGLSLVDPKKIIVKTAPTPTRIEEILVDDQAVPLLPGNPPRFTVPPGGKRLTIRYTALDLGSEDVEFQYRREGLDGKWVNAGTERVARLYDLHPGRYQLTVRARSKERIWSAAEAGVGFTVLPFFWQTTWFLALVVTTLVGGLCAVVWRVVNARSRRRYERELQRRALDDERARSAILAKAKEALQTALQRFEAVVENAPLIAIQGFDEDGIVGHWNAASHALYGHSCEEAIGRRMRELVLAGSKAEEFDAMARQVWTTGKPSEPREWNVRAKSGVERCVYLSMFPIVIAGKTVEVFCMELDVTERKLLEDQLRQSQKMEAVGQLAGGVAHDFNNILTVILGHLGLLQIDPRTTPAMHDSLKELFAAAERATNLTHQLLAFSRRQVLRVKPLDLNEALENLSRMLRRLLGEHIALGFHYSRESAWVHADAGMMEQVVLNFAVNARDAMPRGGKLTVSTAVIETGLDYARHNPEARAGQFICLSVSDTGCGMDSGTLRHIFEPFFTTKAVGKGTGLGLATVYGIVKQHQGWLEVESAVGHGSTFKVFLPACEKPAVEVSAPIPPPVRGGSETLLVVEDEPPVRQLVSHCLRRYGYKVLEAQDGHEALRVWDRHREEIDLLLTDMVMPGGMSGKDLAARLQAGDGALKVIYSSGYNLEMATGNLRLDDEASYLAKPYDPAKLASAVRRCLDKPQKPGTGNPGPPAVTATAV